jgi:GNAT superfamily N-acetyltransferase
MENGIKIVPFDPPTASEELWAALFAHSDGISGELNPGEPLVPRERRRALLLSDHEVPFINKYYYLMMDAGAAAGCAFVSAENPKAPAYESNKTSAHLRLSVLPKYRRRGLGTAFLRHLAGEMAAREPVVTHFMSAVSLEPGIRFMDALGGKVALEQGENRLYLGDVDWAMVEAWAAEGAGKNPDTRALTVTSIPEEDIGDYSRIYSETINQQPLGDLNISLVLTPEQIRLGEEKTREKGAEHVTIYCREADGSISGLTETYYMKETGHRVFQMLTGVRHNCRGRGLGKMLKALMLLHIRKACREVKYVVSSNADSNAPMMAINRALGFKRHRPVLIYKLKLPLAGS